MNMNKNNIRELIEDYLRSKGYNGMIEWHNNGLGWYVDCETYNDKQSLSVKYIVEEMLDAEIKANARADYNRYFSKDPNKTPLERAKIIIKKNILDALHGIFNTKNIAGDITTQLYSDEDIRIDICYNWKYFEVFGLSDEDFKELSCYYRGLIKEIRLARFR